MFDVDWLESAEAELTTLWLMARDRQRITEVIDQIERQLRHDPNAIGESRAPGRRIAFVGPIGFVFETIHDETRVVVLRVWRTR